ncbi:MAG: DUF5940 domain-containing protein, partial [Gemmatimonadetes bacterium]|nr:DUF5940 domain-containing protein [Gemmatimonadota bacterium]
MNSIGNQPCIKSVKLCLSHVPNLVRHGSKPQREIDAHPETLDEILRAARSFEDAAAYPPHQAFIGNLTPEDLEEIARPWHSKPLVNASPIGPDGLIVEEGPLLCLTAATDPFNLLRLDPQYIGRHREVLSTAEWFTKDDFDALGDGTPQDTLNELVKSRGALPLLEKDELIGCVENGHSEDSSLRREIVLENLMAKSSAVLALRMLSGVEERGTDIDYVMGCGEEAVGDRYQRGGGNLAKAVAEHSWCSNATGSDIKAFCCAPNHAIVMGAALVASGLYKNVAVIGGGSLAKLGMKFQGHLRNGMPILEDVLASVAVLIGEDDGFSPVIDLESVGRHTVAAGSSPQAIAEALILEPLASKGLGILDVDRYATELHDPDITEPQGSGNTPLANYRVLASLAGQRKEIDREQMPDFVERLGMPGLS